MTGSWTVGPGMTSSSVGSPSVARGRRRRERDVLVQRRVLVARRRLDRGDDLARDAELREVAEARLAVGAVVAHGLVEADEALLDEVVGVAAGEEVRRGLQADEAVVPAHDPVVGGRIALLGKGDEVAILNLNLTLRAEGDTGHERSFLPAVAGTTEELSGALLPWRHLTSFLRLSRPQVDRDVAAQFPQLWTPVKSEILVAARDTSAAAAAALTLRLSIRPRIGTRHELVAGLAPRAAAGPLPSAPRTSTTPPG